MKRTVFMAVGALLFLILLVYAPIDLPYSVKATGKILPRKNWILTRTQDGCIMSTLFDNSLGSTTNYAVTDVERGDYVSLELLPTITLGASIAAGETIGFIYSNELERQLAQLKGELAAEMASLTINRTGEKEPLIKEAQLRIDHAKSQAEQQRKEVDRLQALASMKMIPGADLENAEIMLRRYEIEVEIAEAELHNVRTGAKPQQVDWVYSRISALKKEIEILKKRLDVSKLISPITGHVSHFFSGETLVEISSTTNYVVLLLVKWKDRQLISPKQRIKLSLEGSRNSPIGRIEHVGQNVNIVGGKQFIQVTAIVEEEDKNLVPGLIARCSIECDPVRPWEFLRRFFSL